MPSEIQNEPLTLVSCDSESRSSFCYQIVVRETENRQLLHFFSLVRGICGSLMCSSGGRKLGSRVPCSDAADATFVRSAQTPLRMRSWYPPFAKNAKDGAPHCVGDASEIKSLGHPAECL